MAMGGIVAQWLVCWILDGACQSQNIVFLEKTLLSRIYE